MRKVLLVVAMLGAMACGGEKTPVAVAVGDVAVDSAAVDGAADAMADSVVDVVLDVTQVVADSPYAAGCKSIAARTATALKPCGCADDSKLLNAFRELCMQMYHGSLDEPSAAGDLVLDTAADATCTAALSAVGQGCLTSAFVAAFTNCALAWFDTAKIGEPCHAAGPLVCGAGQGLCVVVQPPDGFKCFAAGSQGDACSATQPCRVDLACLEGSLPRAKTCGIPGSTCNVLDKCRQGFKCEGGACITDASVTPELVCTP